ncbi:chorismate mutase [Candidatus Nanosalina sp. VS9-1]|uniref:chorismate mutase n=1 Tax=Candidatus Nanosalina sp. VS9-1 TaxID=3388566 RepID=UPI0039DF8DF8
MSLEDAREEIDKANKRIAGNVRDRMDAVLKVMNYKSREDMQIRDEEREEEVKQDFEEMFENKKMPPERGRELAEVLIETAVDIQEDLMEEE